MKSLKDRIHSKINRAFQSAIEDLGGGFRDKITTPQTWEGFENSITVRQNGEIVRGAFRNIVDSSNLRDSQTIVFQPDGTAEISWDGKGITPAAQVLLGGVSESGVFIPGRDWVSPVLYEKAFSERFLEKY